MCTNHKNKVDVIDVFDATYVQCGWDGYNLFVLPDFNKYTPYGIAVVTRPTCSVWRENKASRRGFILSLHDKQQIMWVVKNPLHLAKINSVSLSTALQEVNIYGDFNPYIETSYYDMKGTKYVKCMVTVSVNKALYDYTDISVKENGEVLMEATSYPGEYLSNCPIVAIKGDTLVDLSTLADREYLAYKLVTNDGHVSHVRIVADDFTTADTSSVMITLSIGDDKYSIPADKLKEFKL
jgi:hypothetical protein